MNIKYYSHILLAITILMGALAANLLLSNTSNADPGNGAYVFKDAYCVYVEDDDSNWCYNNFVLLTTTITPSGNTLYVGNGRTELNIIDSSGDIVYVDGLKYHTQGVNMDEIIKEYAQFFTTTQTYGDVTCKSSYNYLEAKGTIKLYRTNDFGCY